MASLDLMLSGWVGSIPTTIYIVDEKQNPLPGVTKEKIRHKEEAGALLDALVGSLPYGTLKEFLKGCAIYIEKEMPEAVVLPYIPPLYKDGVKNG